MKLKEKFEELERIPEAEQFFIVSQVGSFINLMEDAICEINDNAIVNKYKELQDLLNLRRKALSNIEIED